MGNPHRRRNGENMKCPECDTTMEDRYEYAPGVSGGGIRMNVCPECGNTESA